MDGEKVQLGPDQPRIAGLTVRFIKFNTRTGMEIYLDEGYAIFAPISITQATVRYAR